MLPLSGLSFAMYVAMRWPSAGPLLIAAAVGFAFLPTTDSAEMLADAPGASMALVRETIIGSPVVFDADRLVDTEPVDEALSEDQIRTVFALKDPEDEIRNIFALNTSAR